MGWLGKVFWKWFYLSSDGKDEMVTWIEIVEEDLGKVILSTMF